MTEQIESLLEVIRSLPESSEHYDNLNCLALSLMQLDSLLSTDYKFISRRKLVDIFEKDRTTSVSALPKHIEFHCSKCDTCISNWVRYEDGKVADYALRFCPNCGRRII